MWIETESGRWSVMPVHQGSDEVEAEVMVEEEVGQMRIWSIHDCVCCEVRVMIGVVGGMDFKWENGEEDRGPWEPPL